MVRAVGTSADLRKGAGKNGARGASDKGRREGGHGCKQDGACDCESSKRRGRHAVESRQEQVHAVALKRIRVSISRTSWLPSSPRPAARTKTNWEGRTYRGEPLESKQVRNATGGGEVGAGRWGRRPFAPLQACVSVTRQRQRTSRDDTRRSEKV